MKKGEVELTESRVAKLKPEARNYFVCDRACPGFGVEVTPAGAKRYVVKTCITVGGVQRRAQHTLGHWGTKSVDSARIEAALLKEQVRKGEDPKAALTARRQAVRMDALLDRFYKDHLQVAVSWEGKRLVVKSLDKAAPDTEVLPSAKEHVRLSEKFIRPALGTITVRDLGTADVANMLFKIQKDTPVQANRVRSALSRIMSKAEVWELRPAGTNPVRVQERVNEVARDRNLSDREIALVGETLKAAAEGTPRTKPKVGRPHYENPYALAAIRLALLAGMRKAELLGLRWEWVDLEADQIVIPAAFHKTGKKTGKARIVRLCAPAVELLESLDRHLGNPYVFVGDVPGEHLVDLQNPWQRIREAAGLAIEGDPQDDDPGLHDLRRTHGSVAARLGVPELFISALLGHAAGTVTQIYARVGQDPLRETVETIGARIAGLLSGEIDPEKEAQDARDAKKMAKAQA